MLFAAGPIGSTILSLKPTPEDYGGLDGCNEYLTVSKPELLEGIQRSFYEAGCDAVDSATFGANRVVFAEYDIEDRVREINCRRWGTSTTTSWSRATGSRRVG